MFCVVFFYYYFPIWGKQQMNAQCTWTTKYEIFTFFCFGVHQPWRRGVVNVSIWVTAPFSQSRARTSALDWDVRVPFVWRIKWQEAGGRQRKWWVNEIRLRSLIRDGVYTRLRRALSIGIGNGILFIQCYQNLPKVSSGTKIVQIPSPQMLGVEFMQPNQHIVPKIMVDQQQENKMSMKSNISVVQLVHTLYVQK